MKKAFTLIELIFVIVILGILGVIAIPKLAATRVDAEVSRVAQNIVTAAQEIASYAITYGKVDSNLTVMSNAVKTLKTSDGAVLSTKKVVVPMGSADTCITLEVLTSIYDDNLTISLGNDNNDEKCIRLQSLIDATEYPMKLRGQSVSY